MRKPVFAMVLVASLALGGFVVALGAGAAEGGSSTTSSTTTRPKPSSSTTKPRPSTTKPAAPAPGKAPSAEPGARPAGGMLGEVLDELVAKGTITKVQADAIRDALKAKFDQHRKDHPMPGGPGGTGPGGTGPGGMGPGGPGGMGHGPMGGHHGPRGGFIADALDTAAKAIGVPVDDLRTALEDGKSIAEVAASKGVSEQKVIDALVAKGTAGIDKAVADGKLPADRAAQMKEHLPEMAKRMVEAKRP